MSTDHYDQRFDKIDEKLTQLLIADVRIADRLDKLDEDFVAIIAEVGGVPQLEVRGERLPLRKRIHKLENDQAAAKIAGAALKAAQAANSNAWSRRQKVLLFVFTASTFVETLLHVLGYI